ncbi:DUF2188 domain-containing protein [Azospirillum rugosum]|uniref:DUF2188 domain-containing protein n=2 Tax=Azospirillum rugosum TaxID=416170 RepID=A0ABS4SXG8_9PROT|nr:DUF2188 domain-containing protein [Azospirillum rugosum]MBP2296768.1 hypothetical protein [Azospirillum rugosum]MDQ0530371.1 hypothetical protein [Azospirillum rugosum]
MDSCLHLRYIVERQREAWTVRMQGGDCAGAFPSRRDALKAAVRDADRVCDLGHHVEVFARRADGSLKQIADRSTARS